MQRFLSLEEFIPFLGVGLSSYNQFKVDVREGPSGFDSTLCSSGTFFAFMSRVFPYKTDNFPFSSEVTI